MPDFREQRGVAIFGTELDETIEFTVSHPLAVDPSRSFPRLMSTRYTGAGRDVDAAVTLDNRDMGALLDTVTATGFRLERGILSEKVEHRYYHGTLEDRTADQPLHGFYTREVNSQRLGAATASYTGSPVPGVSNLAQTMLWPVAARSQTPAPRWSQTAMTAYLDGSGQVQLDRGDTGFTATQSWAVVEWGSAWTVTRLSASVSSLGVDVPLPGAGPQPWSKKFYVATARLPAGADTLADYPLVRTSKTNPDELLIEVPSAATAGTYTVSVYVLHHPLLEVQHWGSLDSQPYDKIGQNTVDEYRGLPDGPPADPSAVSIIVHSDGAGAGTEYPRAHWGYELDTAGRLHMRRGRTGTRSQDFSAQAVTWPVICRGASPTMIGHTTFSRQF